MSKVIDITPRWLGAPMYPGGVPLQPWQINAEGDNLRDMAVEYYEGNLDETKHVYIKQYIRYYVNAPLFDCEELKKRINSELLSIWEMQELCMEYGLDPI